MVVEHTGWPRTFTMRCRVVRARTICSSRKREPEVIEVRIFDSQNSLCSTSSIGETRLVQATTTSRARFVRNFTTYDPASLAFEQTHDWILLSPYRRSCHQPPKLLRPAAGLAGILQRKNGRTKQTIRQFHETPIATMTTTTTTATRTITTTSTRRSQEYESVQRRRETLSGVLWN